MSYLVDTDWTADYLGDRRDAVRFLRTLAEHGLAVSIITYGEIYEGILFGRNPRAQETGFRNFLRGVDVLPLNRSIMRRFAGLRGRLRTEGQLIGDPDILIAATALHHKLPLITRNERHFARVAGLELITGPANT